MLDPNDDEEASSAHVRTDAAHHDTRTTAGNRTRRPRRQCPHIPRAKYSGVLKLGGVEIECAVLENGQRIVNDSAFQKALGRSQAGGQTYQRRAAENETEQLPI